jgi:hypothetical protein
MAEENKEVVEETTEQPIEEAIEQTIEESKFESADDPDVIKVDLSKPPPEPKNEEVEPEAKEEPVSEEEKVDAVISQEELAEKDESEEQVEDISEDDTEEEIEDKIEEAASSNTPLPENIQKLVDFMDETGGDINDYVQLNRDMSKMDDSDILDEYYRETKSHLTAEERNFLLEDNFGVDQDIDDEKTIRKKKIALKEQVAEARTHLDRLKSKYYEDIKAGSKLTSEQQEAIDFYNKYEQQNEEQRKWSEKSTKAFRDRTDKVFNDKFKGFDYKIGDKTYKFNVKNAKKIKETQSDLNNFVNKFVGKDNTIKDAAGYHKSLYTAMNADAIANHFYEQGKADAIKDQVAKNKNIDLNPRKTHGEVNASGVKYKVLGDSASDFKFKIKSKKK